MLDYPKQNQAKRPASGIPVSYFQNSVLCLAVVLMSVGVCQGIERLSVTGARVNVRSVPDPQGEIVGVVEQGATLSATGVRQDGWVEIAPPVGVSVWLYGELIREGEVAATSVRVRSGPGIGYRPVGTLSKGHKVKALGSKGDWISIAPPLSCTVWISEKFVSGSAAVANRTAVAPIASSPPRAAVVSQASKRPVRVKEVPAPIRSKQIPAPIVRTPPMPRRQLNARKTSVQRVNPQVYTVFAPAVLQPVHDVPEVVPEGASCAAIQGLRLVRNAPQGKPVVVSGVLRASRFRMLLRPSRYRLTVRDVALGASKTACYVIGDPPDVLDNVDTAVAIVGKQYWVQGVREPVVAVSEFRQ